MKTKMNIICILIFVSIIASLTEFYINSGGELWADMKKGSEDGANVSTQALLHDSTRITRLTEVMFLHIHPKNYSSYADSVFNEKTGKWIPAQYRGTVVVEQPLINKDFAWGTALIILSSFIILAAAVILFIAFIKLILKINKSIIFHWTNVHKLRWIGSCMLVMFVAYGITGWMQNLTYEANVSLKDYIISYEGIWDFQLLISGLGVLLIAEIFAIGLRLQEEQELTI